LWFGLRGYFGGSGGLAAEQDQGGQDQQEGDESFDEHGMAPGI
jgi:hypothetical protein